MSDRGRMFGLLAGVILSVGATTARAGPAVRFDQPTGPLGAALQALAAKAGASLIFSDGELAGRSAPALHGSFTPMEAVARLLAGSGLSSRGFGANGIVVFKSRAAEPRSPPAPQGATLTEVVVTATRQPTLAQETPIALSVIPGSSLGSAGLNKPSDLVREVAALHVQPTFSGQQRYVLRGVTSPGEATVGLYYDDTPVAGPAGTQADPSVTSPQLALVDIDRVEVLRGPQGVRYGASAMSGAVRILLHPADPRQASAEVQASVSSVAGGGVGGDLVGVFNQPLAGGRAAVRLVAYALNEPGDVDEQLYGVRDSDEARRLGARLRFDVTAGELSLALTGAYQQGRYGGPISVIDGLGRGLDDRRLATPFRDNLALASAVGRWRHGSLEGVLAVSAYRWSQLRTMDYSRVLAGQAGDPAGCMRYFGPAATAGCSGDQPAAYAAYVAARLPQLLRQPMTTQSTSVELRLSRTAVEGVRWNLGAFFEDRSDRIDSQSVRGDPATGAVPEPLDLEGFRRIRQNLRQGAIFADLDVPVGLGVRLDIGARGFTYARRAYGDVLVPNIISGSTSPSPAREIEEGGVTGLLVASRSLSRHAYAYAQLSQGFRPGGINVVPGLAESEVRFRADRLLNRELGLKTDWAGGRLTVNLALYHIDWSRLQSGAVSQNGSFAFLTNVGDAEIDGQEIDVAATPISGLTLAASAAFDDARLSRDPSAPAALVSAKRGDRPPFAPAHRFTLSSRYQRGLGGGTTGFVGLSADYTGVSHSQFDADAPYDLKMGGYAVFRLVGGVQRGPDAFDLIVDNIFDRRGRALAQGSTFASEQIAYVRPFSLEARVTRRW